MIIVQAKAIPKDESSREKIIEFAQDLIEGTRKEEGNISYTLLSNLEDDTLLFVEIWQSMEALQQHFQEDHFINFGDNIEDLLSQDLIIDAYSAESVDI